MKQDAEKRMEQLSDKKHQLLQQLQKAKGQMQTVGSDSDAKVKRAPKAAVLGGERFSIDPHQLPASSVASDVKTEQSVKIETQAFYNAINQQLNQSGFGGEARFLNYGYASNEQPQYTAVSLSDHTLNKNAIQLVLELVGTYDLSGCDVLDVGCGRGGTLDTLARYFQVHSLTGLDLSSEAIAFCRTQYQHAQFHQGDAEDLPFADDCFDVVTNVESSHNYAHPFRFYKEIWRVLRPGGSFLYTDMLPLNSWQQARQYLRKLGFVVTHDRDITSNVLLSCEQTAKHHQAFFSADNDQKLMGSFLATPGSNMYDAMQNGYSSYRILHLRVGANS